MSHPMSAPAQHSSSSSSSIPIDPQLALYSSYYPFQQQQQQPMHAPQMPGAPPTLSASPSQGSEMQSPMSGDALQFATAHANGKSSVTQGRSAGGSKARKRARTEDDDESHTPTTTEGEAPPPKPKTTRGSRACTVCRRLKMKCVGAEQGGPCKRCQTGNHECVFEESNRGKRSVKKHELLTRSLRKMEKTLDTVLRSIGNPSITTAIVSRSPSPIDPSTTTMQSLIEPSSCTPPANRQSHPPSSPKLHSLPDNALNPLGLLAEASLANRRATAGSQPMPSIPSLDTGPLDPHDDKKVGIASDLYFKPGPMTILPLRRLFIERQVQPEMLNFVSTEEVVALFKIYFEHMNLHCNILDPDFHTPALVCSRSPFLLTSICTIAAKFYDARPELYGRLSELASGLAFNVPARGFKSVEIVQAYLLLTLWGCGAVERYEQDKTWLLLGMGLRMATDLNLHRKSTFSGQSTVDSKTRDLEVRNRERTWFIAFCLDRSFAAQMGKPYSVKEDYIIRNVGQWSVSALAKAADVSIVYYVELQRIMSRALDIFYSGTDSITGLQTKCNYLLVVQSVEEQIVSLHLATPFGKRENSPGDSSNDAVQKYRELYAEFYATYTQLVLNSFGLQDALEHTPIDIGYFLSRTHASASSCAIIVRDKLAPSGLLRYSTDSHFVMISYAVLTLLKLIRPDFQSIKEMESTILALVDDVADVLEKIAVNPHHTPALYSTFLKAVIAAKRGPPPAPPAPADAARPPASSSGETDQPQPSVDMGLPSMGYHPGGTHAGEMYPFHEFQFDGEIGPVMDMSTFPPTMAASTEDSMNSMFPMDYILSSDFWDSVLVPGYTNSVEGLTGGFVFGVGGSGLITPRAGSPRSNPAVLSPAR